MNLHVLELTLQKMQGSFFHWLVFGNFLKNPFSKTLINILFLIIILHLFAFNDQMKGFFMFLSFSLQLFKIKRSNFNKTEVKT